MKTESARMTYAEQSEILRKACRKFSVDILAEAIRTCGGETQDQRRARAAMLDVYGERLGEAAVDAMLDELGL